MDTNQGIVSNKMLAYMEMDAGRQLTEARKAVLRRGGLCFAFSIVHSYMNTTGKLAWWQSALVKLAAWDKTPESLKQPADLTDTDNPDETLDSVFKRMTNYILYNFSDPVVSDIAETRKQTDFLSHSDPSNALRFNSMKGAITKRMVIAGHLSNDLLENALIPDVFNQEAIYLIQGNNHACSIRYDGHEKKWYFYDPNYASGERSFTEKSALVAEIHRILGGSLAIQIASWNKNIQLGPLNQFRDTLFKEKIVELLSGNGLHVIARYTPNQIPALLKLAATHSAINTALSTALPIQQNDGWTALHMIAQFSPNELPTLFMLAKKHPTTIGATLAKALTLQNNNGSTGLHIILQIRPELLLALLALAKINPDIKNALRKASPLQDKKGQSSLDIISQHEQGQGLLTEFFSATGMENKIPPTEESSQKYITVAQLKNCMHLYEIIQTVRLFNLPSAELEAIKKLMINKTDNMSISYDDVRDAVTSASSQFWGSKHSLELLQNPASHADDKSRVGFVIRSIGLCFANSADTPIQSPISAK